MVDAILGIIGSVLYPMFCIIFALINTMQYIFGAFAGIESVKFGRWVGASTPIQPSDPNGDALGENTSGIVYYLMNSHLIKNLFFSILTLAIFLIVIFTAMAFIKNVYTSKPKKWQDIVSSAIKGLANFIFIPVCCLLGVWLSNVLLQTLAGATSSSGVSSLSGQLFVSSAYNANMVRTQSKTSTVITLPYDEYGGDGLFQIRKEYFTKAYAEGDNVQRENHSKAVKNLNAFINVWWPEENKKSKPTALEGRDQEYYANMIDSVYAQSWRLQSNAIFVEGCYHLFEINYILLAGGGIFILSVLFNISFGMVKRLFMLLFLFVISPGMCAMYPLDDGGAVGKWRNDFMKYLLSAYGAVVGMNLFFSLVPIVQNIQLSGATGVFLSGIFSGLIQLLLTIAGLYVVKDLISMFSGYIGAGDALGDGKSLAGSVKDRIKKTGQGITKKTMGAIGVVSRARGAAAEARSRGQKGGGFWSGLGSVAMDLGRSTANRLGFEDFTEAKMDEARDSNFVKGFTARPDRLGRYAKEEENQELIDKIVDDLREDAYKNRKGVHHKGFSGYNYKTSTGDIDKDAIYKEIEKNPMLGFMMQATGIDPEVKKANDELVKSAKETKESFDKVDKAMREFRDRLGGSFDSLGSGWVDPGDHSKGRKMWTFGQTHTGSETVDKRRQAENEELEKYKSLKTQLDDAGTAMAKAVGDLKKKGIEQNNDGTYKFNGIVSSLETAVSAIGAKSDGTTNIKVEELITTGSTTRVAIDSIGNSMKEFKQMQKEMSDKIVDAVGRVGKSVSGLSSDKKK